MKWKVETTGGGFSIVTVSGIEPNDRIYAEENTMMLSAAIYDKDFNPNGRLVRSLITPEELAGESYVPQKRFTRLGRWFEQARIDERQTAARKNSGERAFVVYKTKEDKPKEDEDEEKKPKVTFKSHFPGSVLVWNVRKMAKEEDYLKKVSYEAMSPEERPHGTLIAVRGAFLCGDLRAKSEVYTTGQDDIKQFSGTGDAFQKFSGKGIICLEAPGALQEVKLVEGESVACWPGDLLAFTDGIKLKMIPAGDSALRNEENNDYLILATADKKGGFFYAKSVQVSEFFQKKGAR